MYVKPIQPWGAKTPRKPSLVCWSRQDSSNLVLRRPKQHSPGAHDDDGERIETSPEDCWNFLEKHVSFTRQQTTSQQWNWHGGPICQIVLGRAGRRRVHVFLLSHGLMSSLSSPTHVDTPPVFAARAIVSCLHGITGFVSRRLLVDLSGSSLIRFFIYE